MYGQRSPAKSFLIRGVTSSGKVFRPSDWAERLCGVLACFQPGYGPGNRLQYSPYVQPLLGNEIKCVKVDGELALAEPMAYRFLVNFANDNDLEIDE